MIDLKKIMDAVHEYPHEEGHVWVHPKDLDGLEKAHSLPGTKAESVSGFPIKTSKLIERGNFYVTDIFFNIPN